MTCAHCKEEITDRHAYKLTYKGNYVHEYCAEEIPSFCVVDYKQHGRTFAGHAEFPEGDLSTVWKDTEDEARDLVLDLILRITKCDDPIEELHESTRK